MNFDHIQRKIYEIRGLKVILDFDLAYMYDGFCYDSSICFELRRT